MKSVILAGGLGTRLAEETSIKPKPMVEIGGKPILNHIMKYYSKFGIKEFIILSGYKSYVIKEYFANYFIHMSDVTFDLKENSIEIHNSFSEPWKVTVVDTGLNTNTAGRLKRVEKYLKNEDSFHLTYGDGLSDVDINKLLNFHESEGKPVTMTVTRPTGRFGTVYFEDKTNNLKNFQEKPKENSNWINSGFFILRPNIFDFIKNDNDSFEKDVLPKLVTNSLVAGYKHYGFFQPMDTLRDKNLLDSLIKENKAPWIEV